MRNRETLFGLKSTALPVFLVGVLSASCTEVTITKVTPGSSPEARIGVPYNLAMSRYDITITRRITACGSSPVGTVEIAPVKASEVIDPSQMFVLSSDGTFNTSDLSSTFDAAGVTTSLNATSEDRTAQVISNTIGTVAQIAGIVAAGGGGGTPVRVELCQPDVAAALDKIPTLKKAVDKDTATLAKATKQVQGLTANIVALGANASNALKAQLALALDSQTDAQDALTAAQKPLQAQLDASSYAVTVHWPLDGNTFAQACDAALDPHCTLPATGKGSLLKWASVDQSSKVRSQFDVYFRIDRVGAVGKATADASLDEAVLSKGLPVRFSAPGYLRICRAAPCGAADSEQLAESNDVLLQLGLMYTVPLPQGTFQAGLVAVSTSDTSAPKTVESKVTAAAAETASGMLKDTATQSATIGTTLRGADLAQLKSQTVLLQAKKDLLSAESAASPEAAQTASYQAQTALYNAEQQEIAAKKAAIAAGAIVNP